MRESMMTTALLRDLRAWCHRAAGSLKRSSGERRVGRRGDARISLITAAFERRLNGGFSVR